MERKDEARGAVLGRNVAITQPLLALRRPLVAPTTIRAPGAPSACFAHSAQEKASPDLVTVLKKAGNRALGGGVAGAAAMVINVSALMWIRTTVNYQYRFGYSTGEAFRTLIKEGGGGLGALPRFYRGYFPALMQGPLSRFGDTAANAGVLALFESYESTESLPVAVKTLGASAAASGMRIFLMPMDAWKTTKQVHGAEGLQKLMGKVRANGPTVLWHGALGAASATFVGHYPWFTVYNTLNEYLPQYDRKTELPLFLCRNAVIGFSASAVSDSISNPIRVLKTYRQTSTEKVGYVEAAKTIVGKEGVGGLWARGLKTKIIANGLQGVMFSVAWRYLSDLINKK